jgi:hypothetical protein
VVVELGLVVNQDADPDRAGGDTGHRERATGTDRRDHRVVSRRIPTTTMTTSIRVCGVLPRLTLSVTRRVGSSMSFTRSAIAAGLDRRSASCAAIASTGAPS